MLVITHTGASGTTLTGTAPGDGVAELLKPHRWRWSRDLAAWHLPHSRTPSARSAVIERTRRTLESAGYGVDVQNGAQCAPPNQPEEDVLEDVQRLRRRMEQQGRHVRRLERTLKAGGTVASGAADRTRLEGALIREREELAALANSVEAARLAGAPSLDAGSVEVGGEVRLDGSWHVVEAVGRQMLQVQAGGRLRRVRYSSLQGFRRTSA